MQVTYTINVKRTTLLSNAEVFAINNLNHEQAITFLAASRRGAPTDELESIVAAVKGPLVKTEVVTLEKNTPARPRAVKPPAKEPTPVQQQFSRRKPKEPAYG